MTTRLLLAEEDSLLRNGLCRMLAGTGDIEIVATSIGLEDSIRAVTHHQPDVVIAGIRRHPTHGDEGIRLAAHCRRHHPATGVLLLSQSIEVSHVRALLAQGTERRGYLLQERINDVAELIHAIQSIARGGSAIDPSVIESFVAPLHERSVVFTGRLSPRERDVLGLIAIGRTNTAVADELMLSVKNVEKHINSIFTKLDVGGDQQNHPRVTATLMYLADAAADLVCC